MSTLLSNDVKAKKSTSKKQTARSRSKSSGSENVKGKDATPKKKESLPTKAIEPMSPMDPPKSVETPFTTPLVSQSTVTSIVEEDFKLVIFPDISTERIVLFFLLLGVYQFAPVTPYISGMVLGACITYALCCLAMVLTRPRRVRRGQSIPDIRSQPPLAVPRIIQQNRLDQKFKGWMNELSNYDPDQYHLNNTVSIYVQLDGTDLRLQTPQLGVPKRTLWSDSLIDASTFIKQRHFDLKSSEVSLIPPGLCHKRLWSKKYPICITLAKLGKEKDLTVENEGNEDSEKQLCSEGLLFLFARTGREKEEWYRRLRAATLGSPIPTQMSQLIAKLEAQRLLRERSSTTVRYSTSFPDELSNQQDAVIKSQFATTSFNLTTPNNSFSTVKNAELYPEEVLVDYLHYMSHVMPASSRNSASPSTESTYETIASVPTDCDASLLWTNAVLTRMFFDFFREELWAERIKEKIERKLRKLHMPYFMDTLNITEIQLGSKLPIIQRISEPILDERGLWVDANIAYDGGFQMTLETKANLMKLKIGYVDSLDSVSRQSRGAVTNSDEEDSAESSTDDESAYMDALETGASTATSKSSAPQSQGKAKKFLMMVDKIAASKYFQSATENKFVKKAMVGVSNMKITMTVQVEECTGTLACNIPPPPTDRVWFGFRTNPRFVVTAKPKIGDRNVTIAHIVDWIERKLSQEFQRLLVLPNMEDIPIPTMYDPTQAFDAMSTTVHPSAASSDHTTAT